MTNFLVTGGVGSLGRRLVKHLLTLPDTKVVRVLDTNENGLARMRQTTSDSRMRYLLGNIQDEKRMVRAMENIDVCIHAAAQKHVDLAEYNPDYCLQVNVLGTQTCIDAAIKSEIDKFLFLSSDKSVNAVSTYGRCKALSESLVLDANNYKGDRRTKLSVARPPNYINSDGSIFDLWRYQKKHNLPITVTSTEMLRYFMTFDEILKFLMTCLDMMKGGEIFVPWNVKAIRIIDLAKQFSDNIKIIGMRKGERLEEMLADPEEIKRARKVGDILVIEP
jgi:UDP-N-acetylglucosamine 4,6-dehydratase